MDKLKKLQLLELGTAQPQLAHYYQLDCSPSLQTEPQLRLEAAKSTTGKLIVVVHVVHVPHTIISIGNEAIYQLLLARF